MKKICFQCCQRHVVKIVVKSDGIKEHNRRTDDPARTHSRFHSTSAQLLEHQQSCGVHIKRSVLFLRRGAYQAISNVHPVDLHHRALQERRTSFHVS